MFMLRLIKKIQSKHKTNYKFKDKYAYSKMRLNGADSYKAAKPDGTRLNGRKGDYDDIELIVKPMWKDWVRNNARKPSRALIQDWSIQINCTYFRDENDDLLYPEFTASGSWITKMLKRQKLQLWYNLNIAKYRKRKKQRNSS